MKNSKFWQELPSGHLVFNHADWLDFMDDSVKDFELSSGIKLELIIPWGFEVFNDKNYLRRRLRRFYCYCGITPNLPVSKDDIAYNFGTTMIQRLQFLDPEFYARIISLLVGEQAILFKEPNYSCNINDCLIGIIIRESNDILEDYARYILGTISAILNNIGEVTGFRDFLIPRWRFYQLYLIHEELFGYLLPDFTKNQIKLKHNITKFLTNQVWPFYNINAAKTIATKAETEIIDNLIMPRLMLMEYAVQQGKGNLVCEKVDSFHYEVLLDIKMSQDIYNKAINKISDTYKQFNYR